MSTTNITTFRKVLDWIIFSVVIFGGGYMAYTHQQQLFGLGHLIESKVAPCIKPITYSIGTIDPRFGITKEKFISDLKEAVNIFENPTKKDLYQYIQSGGAVTVNLIYDSRQNATDNLKIAGIKTDNGKASYDALKAMYNTVYARVKSEQVEYSRKVSLYKQHEDAYRAEVNKWNEQGGAPRDEYNNLQAQKEALAQEFAGVRAYENTINSDIDTLNALATKINQLIVQLNLNVTQYNQAGAAAGEFEEGVYEIKAGVQTINIYEYSNHLQLVRVLAHEMGHALGLSHVSDKEAIMYKINSGKSLTATDADISAIKKVCSYGL